LAAWIFRFRFIGIGFGLLGPYVRVFGNYRRRENAIVALAGPGANCLAGGILASLGLPVTGLLVAAVGLINLLPIPGSDGLKVIRAALGLW
jgi:Zn-dependent protease